MKRNYNARAMKDTAQFGSSPTKQTKFIEIMFETIPEDKSVTPERYPYQGYFTDSTTERVIESLEIAGARMQGGDITDLEGLGSTIVQIVVDADAKYGGERVQFVNRPGGLGVTDENRLSGKSLADFAAQMKGFVITRQKSGGATSAKAVPAQAPWDGQGVAPASVASGPGAPQPAPTAYGDIPF